MALGAGAGYFAGAKAAADNALAHRRIDEQAREFDMNAFQRERQMDMQERQQRAASERADRAFAAQEEQRAIQNGRADRDFDFRREQQGIANERADRAFDFQREQFDAGQRRAGEEMDFRRAQADRQNERQDWLDTWQGAMNQQKMDEFAMRREQFDMQMDELRRRKADTERQRQARQDAANSALGLLVRDIEESGMQFNSPEALAMYGEATGQKVNGSVRDEKGGIVLLGDGANPDGTSNPLSPVGYISAEFQRNAFSEYYGPESAFSQSLPGSSRSGSGGGMSERDSRLADARDRRINMQDRKVLLDSFDDALARYDKEYDTASPERQAEIDKDRSDIQRWRMRAWRGLDPFAEEEKPDAPKDAKGDPIGKGAVLEDTGSFNGNLAVAIRSFKTPKEQLDYIARIPDSRWPAGIPKPKKEGQLERMFRFLDGKGDNGHDGRGDEFDPTGR